MNARERWQDRYKKGPDTLYGKRSVRDYIHRAPFELYDIKNDPDEVHNLASDKSYAKLLAELKAKLQKFQEQSRDPWAMKWEYE